MALDERDRDENGEIRHKNGATRIGTLRQMYGDDFAAGFRSDMKLNTFLADTGFPSLTQAVKAYRKGHSG